MASPPRRSRAKRPPRRTLWQRWRANFLTGLVIVAPVLLTVWLIWTVITFVDGKIVPLVPAAYNPSTYLEVYVPGFGLVVFIFFTAVVGALTKNLFGRQLVLLAERWVDRMPIVRSVYNGVKQIIETVLSQSAGSFKKACLIEYPRRGLWAIAFVATDTKGEILARSPEDEMVSVFLPTTPNPTSGFLLFVPRKDVVELDMTVEEAAKLVISAGLVTPPTLEEREAARKAAARQARQNGQGKPRRPRGSSGGKPPAKPAARV